MKWNLSLVFLIFLPLVTVLCGFPRITPVIAKEEEIIYVWKGAPAYKNERLEYYQKLLYEKGITNTEHMKNFVQQLIQENGSLSEQVHGDGGCSVGIPQRYVCPFGFTAKQFIETYPVWKDWKYQMQWMANEAYKHYKEYDGDISRAVIAHNCPVCARENRDSKAGYWNQVLLRRYLLISKVK